MINNIYINYLTFSTIRRHAANMSGENSVGTLLSFHLKYVYGNRRISRQTNLVITNSSGDNY